MHPLNVLTPIAFAVHIGGGFSALAAGTVAIIARKGGPYPPRRGHDLRRIDAHDGGVRLLSRGGHR